MRNRNSSDKVYPSASNVVLLNHELELVQTLPFWSALPYRAASSSKQGVEGVVTNKLAGLVCPPQTPLAS